MSNFIRFMKNLNSLKLGLAIITSIALTWSGGNVVAQDSTTSPPANGAQPATVSQPAPQLSYGVSDVLQLSQAKVGDSTIITYIHNSGNSYGLNAAQIIYLRQQGVSDAVVNAMLDQRSQTTQTAATTASQRADSGTYSAPSSTAATQPTVTYVQTVPSSSVYVIPDTQTYDYDTWFYYHSPYYAYYPAYSCWPYPAVSVSFGFGGGWGGYRGGWHGDRDDFHGGFHGGGFHGSGWHH
jgi:hypothetical protein